MVWEGLKSRSLRSTRNFQVVQVPAACNDFLPIHPIFYKHVEPEHTRPSPPSNKTTPRDPNPSRPMSLMPLHLFCCPDGPRSRGVLVWVNVLASQRKTFASAEDLGSVYGEKAVACSGELYFGWLWDVSLVLEAARDAGVVLKTSGGQSFAI